jgi:hypothetical protein
VQRTAAGRLLGAELGISHEQLGELRIGWVNRDTSDSPASTKTSRDTSPYATGRGSSVYINCTNEPICRVDEHAPVIRLSRSAKA